MPLSKLLKYLASGSSLKLEGDTVSVDGDIVKEPNAVARALAKSINPLMLGAEPASQAQVIQWQDWSIQNDPFAKAVELNQHLESRSYLAGNAPTLADVQVYFLLARGVELSFPGPLGGLVNILRWFDQIQNTVRIALPGNDASLLPKLLPMHTIYKPFSMPVLSKSKKGGHESSASVSAAPTENGKPKGGGEGKAKPKGDGGKGGDGAKEGKAKPAKEAAAKPAAPAPPAEEEALNPNHLDIRVGLITKAWNHPESDKLYCEEIDVGEEAPRQIASGLRHFYATEAELTGRKVLVLANLKPRALAGFKSAGMVLCASNKEHTEVKFVDVPANAKPGDRVVFEGYEGEAMSPSQLQKKKVFEKIAPDLMTDDKGVCNYKGAKFIVASCGEVCTAPLPNAHVS